MVVAFAALAHGKSEEGRENVREDAAAGNWSVHDSE